MIIDLLARLLALLATWYVNNPLFSPLPFWVSKNEKATNNDNAPE